MRARAGSTVLTLVVCQGVVTLGLMVLVPIMPFFVRGLLAPGATLADLTRWTSIALAAPGVGALACAPFAAAWCERHGYRRALLLALGLFVASLLTMALARHPAIFVAGRVVQGASTVSVIVTAYLARVSDAATRGRALGWQESAVAAGALLGPTLGGVLQDVWSVRPLLLAVALGTGVATLALAGSLSEPPRAASGERCEERCEAAVVPRASRALFAEPAFRRWVLAGSLAQAGAFALVNVFALFVDARFVGQGELASKVGLLHALGWCATLAAGPFWGARNDRGDPARHFVAAALLCALALAAMPFAGSLWQLALLRLMQGAAYAALAQSMLLVCSRAAPDAWQGRVTVTARSAMVLGQLLGPFAVLAALPVLQPAATLWLTAAMFVGAAAVAHRAATFSFPSVTEPR